MDGVGQKALSAGRQRPWGSVGSSPVPRGPPSSPGRLADPAAGGHRVRAAAAGGARLALSTRVWGSWESRCRLETHPARKSGGAESLSPRLPMQDAGRPSHGPPVGGRSGFPGKGEPLGLVQCGPGGPVRAAPLGCEPCSSELQTLPQVLPHQ